MSEFDKRPDTRDYMQGGSVYNNARNPDDTTAALQQHINMNPFNFMQPPSTTNGFAGPYSSNYLDQGAYSGPLTKNNFLKEYAIPGMDILSAIGGLYLGNKQIGLAEDKLKFTQEAFDKNMQAQASAALQQQADRTRARQSRFRDDPTKLAAIKNERNPIDNLRKYV